MAQKTDLNVSPYFDDFDETDNFNRVLFRPGFAIQARELTQLQSVLQNQIEQGFSHMFKDGTVVIPGQSGYLGGKNAARYVRIQSSFGGETIDPQQYVNADNPVIITGATSGITLLKATTTSVLKVELTALEKMGFGKTISNPKVFTLDNQVATVTQGQQIAYSGTSEGGGTTTSFKDAALILQVTPSIIGDGNVLLDIKVNNDSPDLSLIHI